MYYYHFYSPYYTVPTYTHPYQYDLNDRQFPPVDPSQFISSAKHMQVLMKDASTILNTMANSRKFAFDLMNAAQQSNQEEVSRLLKSTGIETTPTVSYTPDGLTIHFDTVGHEKCCRLSLALRWM